jgi:hypothetical protein
LADGLGGAGATVLGMVYLANEVSTRTRWTGDHDGSAIVIELP